MVTNELLKDLNLPIKDYYICYFDILGYRAFFENNSEEHKKFLCEILLAIGDIETEICRKQHKVKIEIRTYSDNFLLFFKKENFAEDTALRILCQVIQKIQIKLLMNFKILIRGGITIGEFFTNNQIVFGEGLIRAVYLEEKDAKFPRVVIDHEVFSSSIGSLISEGLLNKDSDENIYVNYFSSEGGLLLVKGQCEFLINRHGRYHGNVRSVDKVIQAERTISKYLWLLMYFNSACERLYCKHLKIDYKLKLNERLLKTEVYCEKKIKGNKLDLTNDKI